MEQETGGDQVECLIRCLPMLRAYVRRLASDSETANELLQNVSVTILTTPSHPRDIVEFAAWSRGVARHVLASELRAMKRAQCVQPVGDELFNAPDAGPDPEYDTASRVNLERLAGEMNPTTFELLFRRYVLGESAKDLANHFAESPAALRMRLMRLRSTIRANGRMPRE
jgi:RNA polymerase sigma factor (sigma-70 family)